MLDGTRCVTHHDRATLIWGGGKFFSTVPLDKKNIFTLQTAPGYTAFTTYCDMVDYDPYLHYYKPDFIPDIVAVFINPAVTHRATPLPPNSYPLTEGKNSPSEVGIQYS